MNLCNALVTRVRNITVFLVLALAFYVPGAWAAGGEMPSLVHDIGISLLTAGVLAIIFTKLRIPSIAAFLVAGILIGPIGLKQVTDPVNIDTIAQLGFILLLFLIGLEIDFKKIMNSGKAIIVSGLFLFCSRSRERCLHLRRRFITEKRQARIVAQAIQERAAVHPHKCAKYILVTNVFQNGERFII